MEKLDLKKELKELYHCSTKDVAFVDVPEMNFLMIDGQGDPNTSEEFTDAVEALYSLSYTLKFMAKKALELDYVVMPLEGLWWTEGPGEFDMDNKDTWLWTLMVSQPEGITANMVAEAIIQVEDKRNIPAVNQVRFESFREGMSGQLMHEGPYSEEGPDINKLLAAVAANGYRLTGRHHEIYLGDPRKSAPERLKTILRHPVK